MNTYFPIYIFITAIHSNSLALLHKLMVNKLTNYLIRLSVY